MSIDQPIPDLPVLYEDDVLLVVNKPSGMLSQPGRQVNDSALSRVLDCRADIHGPALVHRLDMDTSGILLLAKTRTAHRHLQQQFEKRQVAKRYRAVLDTCPPGMGGRIALPLRLDVDNRPRQIVCREFGKPALTLWHSDSTAHERAVVLYPLTGRTHQLRVHAASPAGLGCAIEGDPLYGNTNSQSASRVDERLKLHADAIQFEHPQTGLDVRIESPAPFIDSAMWNSGSLV